MKKGITVVTISIMVVMIIILLGTITVGSYNSIQNGKKLVFALEISNIQEEIDSYERVSADDYPISGTEYIVSLSNISAESITQFDDEVKDGNNIKLYEIDLSLLGIEDTEYGNKQTEKDIYVLSIDTGKVYYLEGVTYQNKTYYTLTRDLIDIKERNEKEKETVTGVKPVITTKAFSIKTTDSTSDIYLTDIKVEGENISKIKYEKAIIEETDAKEYFKDNGFTLNSDRIKVKEGEYITIYAENSSGDYTVRLEGIPKIPKDFYYVGGSIPTGVVISDSSKDANKGTAIDGDVVSDGLDGNQFVWVPVEDFTKFERTTTYDGTITAPSSNYSEPYSGLSLTNDLTSEWTEYAAMKESVQKYGGFYIGRYETGTSMERTEGENGTTDVLVQKNKPVYNYVGWGPNMTAVSGDVIYDSKNQGKGAVELSRNIYKNSTYVVSTLIYGVQWDSALQFISKTYPNYALNSTGKGNYTGILENTGSSNDYKLKNIYDMGGNLWEWTMEARDAEYRYMRGGHFQNLGIDMPAGKRLSDYSYVAKKYNGFRIALYLK